jgi:hypothetical protein
MPWTAADGERLDSHRRFMRWITNHYLVPGTSLAQARDAVKQGRGWMVVEGLGTPVGVDFYADINGTVKGVGETGTWAAGTRIRAPLPALHPQSPQGVLRPIVNLRLRKLVGTESNEVVASASNAPIDYLTTGPGIYRLEIGIVPVHLEPWADYDAEKISTEYPWVITNPIYLEP